MTAGQNDVQFARTAHDENSIVNISSMVSLDCEHSTLLIKLPVGIGPKGAPVATPSVCYVQTILAHSNSSSFSFSKEILTLRPFARTNSHIIIIIDSITLVSCRGTLVNKELVSGRNIMLLPIYMLSIESISWNVFLWLSLHISVLQIGAIQPFSTAKCSCLSSIFRGSRFLDFWYIFLWEQNYLIWLKSGIIK